tara:strand:+ start:1884 stop:2294 length:411 start_codon:yes stop_codon:yes gene_type:complete
MDWTRLVKDNPDQASKVSVVSHETGETMDYIHIKTELFNKLKGDKTLEDTTNPYTNAQLTKSIDSLTNQLKQLDSEVESMSSALKTKFEERNITRTVLYDKLSTAIHDLADADAIEDTEEIQSKDEYYKEDNEEQN